MAQEITIYIIIATALILAIRWIHEETRKARRGNIGCAGCPLSDKCDAKKRDCYTNKGDSHKKQV